ncbi:hypothetical protein CEQ90_20365 [Lewinellaceae bacterium SD302]|nr:hypothetical protein CEQ90_20365 [Lewinellaceae bacterium SD302]
MSTQSIEKIEIINKKVNVDYPIYLNFRYTYNSWRLAGDFILCLNDRYLDSSFQRYSNSEAKKAFFEYHSISKINNIKVIAFTKYVPEDDGFLYFVEKEEKLETGLYFMCLDRPHEVYFISSDIDELFELDELTFESSSYRIRRKEIEANKQLTFRSILTTEDYINYPAEVGFLVNASYLKVTLIKDLITLAKGENDIEILKEDIKIYKPIKQRTQKTIILTLECNSEIVAIEHRYPTDYLDIEPFVDGINEVLKRSSHDKRYVVFEGEDINGYIVAYLDSFMTQQLSKLYYINVTSKVAT